MEKSKFSLEARPGKIGYVEFNGYDLKGYDPKYRHFVVLDRHMDPHDYEGGYICRLIPKLDKNNNTYYIASPHMPVPTFEEMCELCLNKIFATTPKRTFHTYAFSAYYNFVDMISTFTMPLSTLVFRMLVMYFNFEIESREIAPEMARTQYDLLCKNLTHKMHEKEIQLFCREIELDKTVRDFIQLLFTHTERKEFDEVEKLIGLLYRRQNTEEVPYYMIPSKRHSDTFFFNHYREKFPNGSNVTAAVLYQNFEVDITNIPQNILMNGEFCSNYNFGIIDHRQLIVKMKKQVDILDSGVQSTAEKILENTTQFNDPELKDYAISSAQSVLRTIGDGSNFLGYTKKNFI